MEPQSHRVVYCSWHMVGISCVEYAEYVLDCRFSSLLSHVPCACEDLTLVSRFTDILTVRTDAHAKSNKLDTMYSPIANACIIQDTDHGLLNATGVLAADAVLLLTMLVGLLRHPHRSSTGIWKFLYQQVTFVRFYPACVGC